MFNWLRKIDYQLKMIRYLKAAQKPNRYRIGEQKRVLLALFGVPLKDKSLEKHLKNLDFTMKDRRLYDADMKRMGYDK